MPETHTDSKSRVHTCGYCKAPTPNSFNACDACIETTTTAGRAAQGLGPKVTDPATNERLSVLFGRAS